MYLPWVPCGFPALNVRFPEERVLSTPWAGSAREKMTLACQGCHEYSNVGGGGGGYFQTCWELLPSWKSEIQRRASSLSCAANENDTYPGKSRAASSPLCRIVCNVRPRGVLFTDSREQERHNALMSLISLPSCHFAPPWALSLCLPVGSAVSSNVCLPVFPVTGSVETSQHHSFYPNLASAREQGRRALTHTHIQTCV